MLSIPTLLFVIAITGAAVHLVPGDPVERLLGDFASSSDTQKLRAELGLDKNLIEQIITYTKNVFQLDLGKSLYSRREVSALIATRILPTFELAFFSVLLSAIFGIALGLLSAAYSDKALDQGARFFSLLGVSIPNFWLGPLLILVFSIYFPLFPVSERAGLPSYVLPCFTLGFSLSAIIARMVRNTALDILSEDYILMARSKGQSEFRIYTKHLLPNVFLPLLTLLSLQFGVLLTGSVITERIFDWPGLGTLILEAIESRDYPLIQGCVLVFSLSYVLINLLTDILYKLVDPRIRYEN